MFNQLLATKNKRIATILAFAIIPISGLTTDIYLPSMPSMGKELGVTESQIQLTLTLFLISYGVTQFLSGALVDAFGRYKITLISLLLFILSFWITANTENIYIIYLMRIAQGILSGFAVVAKRAFFVDVYEGEERRNYLSMMTIIWSLAPIIAPFIGGYLQIHFNWQANFTALAIYCSLIFVLELLFSGETIRQKNSFKINFLLKSYSDMFKASDFFYGMLMCGVSYSLIMFFNLCGPFIIEHTLGYSAIITGYVSLIMGFAWMSGGFLGKALIKKDFFQKIKNANFIQLLIIVVMLGTSFWLSNLFTLAFFAFLIHVTAGFIFNNYFSYCLGRFPNAAGLAGGLTGGMAYLLTSTFSYSTVTLLQPISQLEVSFGYLILSFLGLLIIGTIGLRKAYV